MWLVAPAVAHLRAPPSTMCLAADALAQHGRLPAALPLTTIPDEPASTTVRRAGVARLDGVLTPTTAARLRAHVLDHINNENNEYSEVLSPRAADGAAQTRWDLRLPLAAPVRAALRELLRGPLGDAFSDLCGSNAELWELAALVSAGGAAPQLVHADVLWDPDPLLFTAFVALQDVSPALGPTRFFPGTHTEEAHDAHDDDDDDAWLAAQPAHRALLGAGDASLYDARTLHCGDANAADARRALFYVTFRHEAAAEARSLGNEAAHSILAPYDGRWRLGRWR